VIADGPGRGLASKILVSESVASRLLLAYKGEVQVDGAGYSALCVPGRAFFAWLQEEAALSGLLPRSQASPAPTGERIPL
jgi:hypothetical protein